MKIKRVFLSTILLLFVVMGLVGLYILLYTQGYSFEEFLSEVSNFLFYSLPFVFVYYYLLSLTMLFLKRLKPNFPVVMLPYLITFLILLVSSMSETYFFEFENLLLSVIGTVVFGLSSYPILKGMKEEDREDSQV